MWLSRVMQVAGLIALCLVSGLIGGALVRHVGTRDHSVSYSDFISIMLTAISLLMTLLAIFLAVAGFVGWSTIEQKVQGRTEDFLDTEFSAGGRFYRAIIETAARTTRESMFEGVQSIDEEIPSDARADLSQTDILK